MKGGPVPLLLLLGAVLLFSSCALHFPDGGVRKETQEVSASGEEEPATVALLMFADELHTGLILERGWLERHGYRVPPELKDSGHLVFSWGDETAYVQERWLSPAQVVHALFLPSSSVMEVIPVSWNVPDVMPTQRLYQGFAKESAGKSLADFLNRCSVMDGEGNPVSVASSGWGKGRLVESPHAYYFPRICNVWTVDALNAAGFRINGLTGLSAEGLIRQIRNERNGFQKIWAPEWQMELKEDAP